MALFGHTILCDYVYVDRESQKPVLAGVFSGDMVVPVFPTQIRCSIYAELLPPKNGSHKIEMKLLLGKKQMAGAIIEVRDAIVGTPAQLIVPQFDMRIDEETTFVVNASTNGGRVITLLRKQIILRAQP